ncbi:LacI family DNA-binding transcriptional regulator [uncultured Pseudokineococcus sp.]|uniref:LacI family DNA-binding transcriptional regulator n=1 Tax=uncultured Pseudokineococcus sp. TaxID=1642928 RepID=UPI002609C044|nr:LacI family DNA-binding transcriptional regulator [uncultured Pseudokineococcus sp.]
MVLTASEEHGRAVEGHQGSQRSLGSSPDRQAGRATIHTVAARAGVSHQTVSRYLKGDSGMKPSTVEVVERAVRELDYRPDAIARSMRTRRSRRLAVLLPDLTHGAPVAMLRGAAAVAHAEGYEVEVVSLEGGGAQRSRRLRDLLRSSRLEGVLSLAPLEGVERSAVDGTPVVVAEEFDDRMRSFGATSTAAAAADILDHLVDLGHRHLLHVSGPPGWVSARNRRDVFLAAARRRGLPAPLVREGDWSVTCGYEAVLALPAGTPVTGVFAANDFTALGVLRGLQARGLGVPADASVVGWDDESFAPWSAPGLTTVSVDREALGRQAMTSLVDALPAARPTSPGRATRGEDAPDSPLMRLVLRSSTGPAPGRRRPLTPPRGPLLHLEPQPERLPDAGRTPHD